jgi:uncharacterized protein (DUF2141 family)
MTPKILVAVLLYCSALTAAGATDLTVTISGARNATGSISAGIFNSESSFPKAPVPAVMRLEFGAAQSPGN